MQTHVTVNRGEDVLVKDGQEVEAQELLKKLEAEHAAQKNVRSLTAGLVVGRERERGK